MEHEVIIAGGGPTGMMLAAELKLAGVDVAIIERRPNHELAGSRAGGLHARSLEIFDQRGIAERFVAEGQKMPAVGFAFFQLDISDFPTRYNFTLGLWQNHIERILAEWIRELGVSVRYGIEVTACAQDDGGVAVTLSVGTTSRAQYLVGCDGGRSLVRKSAGIEFHGSDPTISHLIAEVEMKGSPEPGMRRNARGTYGIGRVEYEIVDGKIVYKDEGPLRVMITEAEPSSAEPTLDDLRNALIDLYGTDYGVHSPAWISRFTDMSRQAANYRKGRVLLGGDAAHVHYPAGGQGLNTGVQDAVNLGWKLAQVVKGISPDTLLDTYHAERHPVGARVLQNTMAQVALSRTDDRSTALRETISSLLAMDEPRKKIAGMITALDVRYELGEGHPVLGRRMPDLDVVIDGESVSVYSLLRDARPLLLNFGESGSLDIGGWASRVRLIDARCGRRWELPVIGSVPGPSAVLIRPDGHVAWVGTGSDNGLTDAMRRWFGDR
jgi:2-polyprenyl-6-methoxyphenol hydroxylase-like FAD-dependent oxidoreductase